MHGHCAHKVLKMHRALDGECPRPVRDRPQAQRALVNSAARLHSTRTSESAVRCGVRPHVGIDGILRWRLMASS